MVGAGAGVVVEREEEVVAVVVVVREIGAPLISVI